MLSAVVLSIVVSTGTIFNKIDCNLRTYFCEIGFFFWRSNDWQKVQFNTHLLKQRHRYLYRRWWHWLILKGLIKMKDIIGRVFGKLKRQIVFTLQVFFVDTGLNHLIKTKRVWKECTLSAGGGGEVPAEPEIPWTGLPSSHPSSIQAQCCLTSVIEWELVCPTW